MEFCAIIEAVRCMDRFFFFQDISVLRTMSEEKRRAGREEMRHLTVRSPVIEMTGEIRIESEQKTNGIYLNHTEFHRDGNTSDYSDDNDANKNCHCVSERLRI